MNIPIKDKKLRVLILAVCLVLVLEILSILGIQLPMPYAPVVFSAFILLIGHQVISNGIKALFTLNFSSINLLMFIAVCGAFYLGEYPEASVVIVLYVLGEQLEEIGIKNSKSALDQLISNAPKQAFVKALNEYIPIDKIQLGTIIQIKPGESIPIDGKVVSGETTVDESTITGEPIPKDKHIGDILFAGTLNMNGFVEIETTKISSDTTLSKIVKLTFEATANKGETQKFIQQFSKYYTPAIIAISILMFVIPVFILGSDFNKWLEQALTLLVIACPCALVISTPIAIYSAIGNASAKGALVKGGKYIEALAKVKAIALDKTRTITLGNPIVSDVIPFNNSSHEELLACSAGAEVYSEHPLAQAIVAESRNRGFEPHKAEKFQSTLGKGATATCLVCEDKTILLGKLTFIKQYESESEEAERIVEQLSNQGKTSVVVSFGKGIAGVIALTDEIRTESLEAIKELKSLGIELIILTGDNPITANYVAKEMGINKIYGGLLPENKAEKVKELLTEYNNVAMVGDGINDAPALALSTVGIAMGATGSDTAIETANVALMNDKLTLIPFLLRLSRKTVNRIKLNTIFAVAVKLIFLSLALFGYSNLVLAIVADVGVTLFVILFSLQLMKFN